MDRLTELLNKYNYKFSDEVIHKFKLLMSFVLEKNKQFNLTTITDENEFYVKHIIDSLSALNFFENNSEILDIGSGAGFPALVLKLANPTLKITMLDSVNKKVMFLNEAIKLLNITDITAIHSRIEDFALKNYEKFDYVTSRAVAPLSTLMEYSLPFLKIGGKMIAYKGLSINEELENCKNSLKILGGNTQDIIQLNIEDNQRNILIIKKEKHTPKDYPRTQNKPRIKPLN